MREAVISYGPGEIRAALLIDGTPWEFLILRGGASRPGQRAGAIHLGRIAKLAKDGAAAFVDLGGGLSGFLPASAWTRKLSEGDAAVMQIAREAYGSKAARMTMRVTTPPPPVPLDTVAPALLQDAPDPLNAWLAITAPEIIRTDYPPSLPALRRVCGAGVELAELDAFFEEELDKALSREVPLPSGGRLIIDPAEALTAIDVDTATAGADEAAAATTNREAAGEIARQLRLRNIGGIVVIDFVFTRRRTVKEEAVARLSSLTATDPVPVEIAGVTRLGLVELTRKRTRPSLSQMMNTPEAAACRALRAALKASRATPAAAYRLRATPPVARALAGPLRPALLETQSRLGRPLPVLEDPALPASGGGGSGRGGGEGGDYGTVLEPITA